MPFMNPFEKGNPYFNLGPMVKLADGIRGHLINKGAQGVYLVNIVSLVLGKGNVGRYLDQLIIDHPLVKVPNVFNPRFEAMLKRRGFKKKHEHVPMLNGHAEVYVHRRKGE